MEIYFDHEKLKVYQKAIDFINWSECIFKKVTHKISVIDQFDRASVSIALNIAEVNGKYSGKDRCRYFDIARGSALECSSCLDILFPKHFISEEILREGKTILKEIVSMLVGLIKSNSDRHLINKRNITHKFTLIILLIILI